MRPVTLQTVFYLNAQRRVNAVEIADGELATQRSIFQPVVVTLIVLTIVATVLVHTVTHLCIVQLCCYTLSTGHSIND